MECQDWNTITFNTPSQNKKKEEVKKVHSNKISNDPEKVRMEAPKQLGQLIVLLSLIHVLLPHCLPGLLLVLCFYYSEHVRTISHLSNYFVLVHIKRSSPSRLA